MSEHAKQIIKSINDGDMVKTKEAFTQAIAQKVYDNLENRKQEVAQTIFDKRENEE
ncbi:MAG: hypothetical protein VW270_20990 [Candidatus Poseidoniales archaeon]|jgi:hypothetical protein